MEEKPASRAISYSKAVHWYYENPPVRSPRFINAAYACGGYTVRWILFYVRCLPAAVNRSINY
ncbi:MAG: hypothetical protein V7K50_07790 [Nostoc sp.]|uniref:hypothetical protein n=1 Tax=Nostoc sp. TaxID=1180 RepID=UPI002FFBD70E